MEINTKFRNGFYTLEITEGGTIMNPGLMDQKEANEMAKKFRDAADYLEVEV